MDDQNPAMKEIIETMKTMDKYSQQEIARYIKGVSDGIAVTQKRFEYMSKQAPKRSA